MGTDIHTLRNLMLEQTEDICIYTVGQPGEWGQREARKVEKEEEWETDGQKRQRRDLKNKCQVLF